MGGLFSRKRKSCTEELEQIENEIDTLEMYKLVTQTDQKRTVTYFLILSLLLYLAASLIVYLWYFPSTIIEAVIRLFPVAMFPGLIWASKVGLNALFTLKMEQAEARLEALHRKRKVCLERVKDTETYTRAKEILERFDPDAKLARRGQHSQADRLIANKRTPSPLRQRLPLPKSCEPSDYQNTSQQQSFTRNTCNAPFQPQQYQRAFLFKPTSKNDISTLSTSGQQRLQTEEKPLTNQQQLNFNRPIAPGQPFSTDTPRFLPPQLPAPILPRDRSVLDKVIDYILGDGPHNRFALICSTCSGHNGMALKEEFEFTAFRCCYCGTFNPSRQLRPDAPTMVNLPTNLLSIRDSCSSTVSRSSSNNLLIAEEDVPVAATQGNKDLDYNSTHVTQECCGSLEPITDDADSESESAITSFSIDSSEMCGNQSTEHSTFNAGHCGDPPDPNSDTSSQTVFDHC